MSIMTDINSKNSNKIRFGIEAHNRHSNPTNKGKMLN